MDPRHELRLELQMDEVLRACARTWRRLGVPRGPADEMLAELRDDLAAARAAGVEPQSYVGGDAVGMARAWASARALVRPRFHVGGVMAVALLATVPLMFAASFIYVAGTSAYLADLVDPGWASVVHGPESGDGPVRPMVRFPLWLFFGWYSVTAVAGLGGILLAVSAYLRHWADPVRRQTLRALGAAVLPAAVVSGFAVAGVSKALGGDNSTLAGQVAQFSTFAVVFVACLGLARATVVAVGRRGPEVPAGLAAAAPLR